MTTSPAQPSEPRFFKSSYSEGSGNACIEVAIQPTAVLVRDSKDLEISPFAVSPSAWSAFVMYAVA
ncbi:DUF397 domain-containing protein [Streptomyces rubiginosohelvolus]